VARRKREPAKKQPKQPPEPKAPACVEHQPVPYVDSEGALGHGWECARCGELLQVG
jgi:hypothetical protein